MTKRELAALACKVLGLYAFISALNWLPVALMPILTGGAMGAQAARHWMLIVNALPGVLLINAALILWFGADALACWMVKEPDAPLPLVTVGTEAQVIAFSCLGLGSLLQAVPHIGQIITKLYISQQDALIQPDFKGMAAPDIIALLLQTLIGLWLLFGAAGLARLIGSFRHIGEDKPSLWSCRLLMPHGLVNSEYAKWICRKSRPHRGHGSLL